MACPVLATAWKIIWTASQESKEELVVDYSVLEGKIWLNSRKGEKSHEVIS